ncbi:MAG: nickel-dependent hydrogenase large subunit, partial [Desulfovibrionaceae bacterium]
MSRRSESQPPHRSEPAWSACPGVPAGPVAGGRDKDQGPERACREIPCPGNAFVVRVRLVRGRVDEAWSTGRMLRNANVLLRGELDDQGQPRFAQQAHCLCNDGHALAAVRALEALAGVTPPRPARLVRSLVQACRCIQEHLLHVYHFHLSDWAGRETALRADPAAAARLTTQLTDPLADHPDENAAYFRRAQDRLRALAREPGAEAPAPDGHPDLRGPDELHLVFRAHALDSLRTGAELTAALDLLGCGPDGFKPYCLGGPPEDLDLGAEVRRQLGERLRRCRAFIDQTFLPDLTRLARAHAHWAHIGAGRAFLSCDDFLLPGEDAPLFPGGLVVPAPGAGGETGGSAWRALRADGPVREEAEPRWSPADRDRYRLRPDGRGPGFRWGQGEFAWLPAPRLGREAGDDASEPDFEACEAGPLARVLGAWVRGREPVRRVVRRTLDACGLGPAALNSTLGRVLARGMEASVLAEAALAWLDELDPSDGPDPARAPGRAAVRLPSSGQGTGRVEVPRGMLTHTIRLEDRRIAAHDYRIPTLWNFSPRDSHGRRGPLEQALLGTPV